MADHNELGIRGEQIAREYLSDKSFRILETNWRYGHLEIDIIARLKDRLIIAEVKTRSENFLPGLSEMVNRNKQRLLINAANSYIRMSRIDLEVRFDILFVVFDKNSGYKVYHIEDAFNPASGV